MDLGHNLSVLVAEGGLPYDEHHGAGAAGLGVDIFQVRRRGQPVTGVYRSFGFDPLAGVHLGPAKLELHIGQ